MSDKDDFIKFADLVRDMREAQRMYFASRKGHDVQNAGLWLAKSVSLEREVDSMYKELIDKLKNGEQGELF